jgi:hypothetical protein
VIGHWLPDKTSDNLPSGNFLVNGEKSPTGDNMSSKQAVAGSSPVSRSTRQVGTVRKAPHRADLIAACDCSPERLEIKSIRAIITIRRALRRDFARHRHLARITLPLWLYVVVTGYAVYFWLYRI